MELDLSNFNVSELRELSKKIDIEIEKRQSENRKVVLEQIKELVQGAGMTIEQVAAMARKAGTKSGRRTATMYINPANSKQTWSGKGRRPTWVNNLLASGGTLKDIAAR